MGKDKVYYDESCYVCSLEINTIRKRGEACGIEFVDISSEEFKQSKNKVWNDFETEMVGEFSEDITIGAETFRKLYEKMGLKRTVAFSRLPVVRTLVDAGYFVFSRWIRPNLPKKK